MPFEPHKTPQKKGMEMLMSGEFGRIGHKRRTRAGSKNLAKAIMERAYKTRPAPREDLSAGLVPNSNGTVVALYDSNVYSGQFSLDSSFYYTCCQDFRMHIYDMTHPPISYKLSRDRRGSRRHHFNEGVDSTMKQTKTIRGHQGWWTITDSHLSPDNERMIYSSHTSTVYMVKTKDSDPTQVPLNFSDASSRRRRHGNDDSDDEEHDHSCSIWSARFSADGNEVIAGGNGHIFVYDLLADKRTVKIKAHGRDVNSCCWADTASGNVLISASDDTFLKVWDRRSLGSHPKPSGVLIGHTEGITYVSAKGDGRYVISNGKDQSLRLWDLRKMRSNEEFERCSNESYGMPNYDYRYGLYKPPRHLAHPKDCSVMAYRGHSVFRTLIRCHFSPAETTGGAYIYSGSADSKIYIWSLDGRLIQTLDRRRSLPMSFDPSAPELDDRPLPSKRDASAVRVIRDVSWHSSQPILMSAAWEDEGGRGRSSVARHEWKGLNKMNNRLEDWIEKEQAEASELSSSQSTSSSASTTTSPSTATQVAPRRGNDAVERQLAGMPGAFWDWYDDLDLNDMDEEEDGEYFPDDEQEYLDIAYEEAMREEEGYEDDEDDDDDMEDYYPGRFL